MARLGPVRVGGTNPVRIMGILNTSPESFYKGSIRTTRDGISDIIHQMEDEGADIIDVGGMSTAPYLSTMIPEREESERVERSIKAVQAASNLPISVDTCRSRVARVAMDLGVDILNDVTGLKYDSTMSDVLRRFQPSVVLCAHATGVVLGDVAETSTLLQQSVSIATSCGIPDEKIVLDPAVGFFRRSGRGRLFSRIKTNHTMRDMEILGNLEEIKHGFPLLISVSRKSFLGRLARLERPEDRLSASLACEALSVLNGADVIRTHDVQESREVATIAWRLARKKPSRDDS